MINSLKIERTIPINNEFISFSEKSTNQNNETVSNDTIKLIIENLNSNTFLADKLRFGFSEEIDQLLIKIYDKESDKVIRQFPSEEFIKRIIYFKDVILNGSLLDEKG